MLPSFVVYGGLMVAALGAFSLIRPLRFIRIHSRRAGALVAASGFVLMAAGFAVPVSESHGVRRSRLDEFMPVWQFDERHTMRIHAPPERVYAAIRDVRADEIFLFRTLTSIRRFGRKGPENILNAPAKRPILDVATSTTFISLADDSPRELVVGTVVVAPEAARGRQLTAETFRAPLPPGFALAAMNFVVAPDQRGGSIVSTETRVFASDASARRAFAVYWRIIHPGSDIIRRMWLRAIKRRAEQET